MVCVLLQVNSNYVTMYYSNTNAVGIREKGGRQLMQVSFQGVNREVLQGYAEKCIALLEADVDLNA